MKFGCNLSRDHDPQRFGAAPRLSQFLELPLAADTCDYSLPMRSHAWGEMLNTQIGCCVIAARYHLLQSFTANTVVVPTTVSDVRVRNDYTAITGYDPERPETDQGTVPITALRYWARKGEIAGFALVDFVEDWKLATALQLFGGLFVAYDFPEAWKSSRTWDKLPENAPSAGGHMVCLVQHDRQMTMTAVSWGEQYSVTRDGHHQKCAECWVLIDPAWMHNGKTIQGLDMAGLVAAARAID